MKTIKAHLTTVTRKQEEVIYAQNELRVAQHELFGSIIDAKLFDCLSINYPRLRKMVNYEKEDD